MKQMIKATLRIPMTEPYAYIELETEAKDTLDAIEQYNHAIGLIKPTIGIPEKNYNAFLDTFLETNSGDVNIYQEMSKEQKDIIQAIKRSLKRIEAKNTK